ncbi:MAG TPA: Cro/CI family transcriptional regulator [Pseudorhizobium sp.]|nr:Cro/CI family transcriptional regulator [Pseudorhizobium sp.]
MGTNLTALGRAINSVGSASELARRLRVTPAAVLQWRKVPAERVLEVERITGVSRHDLRPDVFGPIPEAAE